MMRLSLFLHGLSRFMRSNRFFVIALVIFGLAAGWMATASLYPMAFDEEFHFGLIRIYATSWLPYGIEHTRDMAQYGAATADPSYLFHYLMSFPYRLLHGMGVSEQLIIIVLRFLNLGFIIAALTLFRRSLVRAGFNQLVANLSMVMVMLIPVLSMLAAQINYDSLLLLAVALSFDFLVRLTRSVQTTGRLSALWLWLLVGVVLIGMSIKYAFLPIAAALAAWVLMLVILVWRYRAVGLVSQLQRFIEDTMRLSPRRKSMVAVLMVVGIFFASHYIVNAVTYGHPIPDCADVFDDEACTAYGPWNRNRNYARERSDSFVPLSYPKYMTTEWFPGMTERLTFALAGKTNGFQTKGALPLVVILFVALASIGAICLFVRLLVAPRILQPMNWFVLLVTLIYVGVLSLQLYNDYVATGRPVAINGRYLLLVLPFVAASTIDAVRWASRRLPRSLTVGIAAVLLLGVVLGGGGASTYILQSEPHWYWQGWGQESAAVLQAILDPIIVRWQPS